MSDAATPPEPVPTPPAGPVKAAPRRPPPVGGLPPARNEVKRLVLMIAAAVALFGIYLYKTPSGVSLSDREAWEANHPGAPEPMRQPVVDPAPEDPGSANPPPEDPAPPPGTSSETTGPTIAEVPLDIALRDVQDRTPIEQDPPFNALLHHIVRTPPEAVRSAVRPQATLKALMTEPAAHRGAAVRLRATVMWVKTNKPTPNPAGVDLVYQAFLLDDAWMPLIVYSVQKPPVIGRLKYDQWEVEGVFLKTVAYETQTGTRRIAPLVMASFLNPVKMDPTRSTRQLLYLVIAAAVLGLGLLLAAFFTRRDRDDETYAGKLKAARAAKAKDAAGGASPPPGTVPPPSPGGSP